MGLTPDQIAAYSTLVADQQGIIGGISDIQSRDFTSALNGSEHSRLSFPSDGKAYADNAGAFTTLDLDIQHAAAQSTISQDFEALKPIESSTIALAAGGVGATDDFIRLYQDINSLITTHFLGGIAADASIAKATTLTIPPPGIAAGAPAGTVPVVSSPATHGFVTLGHAGNAILGPGTVVYTPNADFVGRDSFSYQNTVNGQPVGAPVAFAIDVTPPVNSAPVANDDLFMKAAGTEPLTVDAAHGVLANDTDPFGKPLTAVLVNGPSDGALQLNPNGSFTYAPSTNGPLVDHFTYYDTNGSTRSPTQTAWIAQAGPPSGPPLQAQPHTYSVPANQPTSVAPYLGVLATQGYGTGSVSAFVTALPGHGTVSLAPDGAFEYIPTNGFVGQDHFTYIAADGHNPLASATVTVNVGDFMHG